MRLLDPRLLEEDYPIRTISESKRLLSVFTNGPITFVNLRAVSREVSKFKRHESFQWLSVVESWILLVRLQKYLRIFYFQKTLWFRAVIKSRGPGISPGYYECGPWLLSLENRRKIEPKEIPSCSIPHLLVVFTRQLEILTTTLWLDTLLPSALVRVVTL